MADVHLVPALKPFALRRAQHKVAYGGRAGGKSWTVARILLLRARESSVRILCVREVQRSIRASVHKLLSDQLHEMGLQSEFDVQATTIRHRVTGSEFFFSGIQDHTSAAIKSYEGIDICWVEEAQSVSEASADVLVPTVRKPGSETWWTFNPTNDDDYVYQRFVKGRDDAAIVIKVNADDNPWLSDESMAERERMRLLSDDMYRHVWLGECRSQAGLLFKRAWFKTYDRAPANLNIYIASDYAVTVDGGDWTEHGVWGMDEAGDLYVLDWWSGQTAPDAWIDAWLALVRRWQPVYAFEESGVILRAVDGAIHRAMRDANTYTVRCPLPSAGNKTERALGFAARASAGTVYFPRSEWATRAINQLCAFDGQDGRTDDMVDVCSLIARGLRKIQTAMPEPPRAVTAYKPFTFGDLVSQDEDKETVRVY